MQMCVTEVGHVMRHAVWHVCDEMSVVSPGLGGLRDRSRTEGRTSYNTVHDIFRNIVIIPIDHMLIFKMGGQMIDKWFFLMLRKFHDVPDTL